MWQIGLVTFQPNPINLRLLHKNMAENIVVPADKSKQPLKFDSSSSVTSSYRRKLSEEISERMLQLQQTSDPQLPERYELLVRALTQLDKPLSK